VTRPSGRVVHSGPPAADWAVGFDLGYRQGWQAGYDAGYAAAERDMGEQWARGVADFHRQLELDRRPDERVALADAYCRAQALAWWDEWHRRQRNLSPARGSRTPVRRVS
jgi:hypothetical protein